VEDDPGNDDPGKEDDPGKDDPLEEDPLWVDRESRDSTAVAIVQLKDLFSNKLFVKTFMVKMILVCFEPL
jgi:hypothetical protein